jgi:hypothetical protein
MPNEDTAPIPVVTSTARPGTRAVAFLFAAGLLLIGSTFLDLVTLPLPGGDSQQLHVSAWDIDLGIGQVVPQYVGVIALVVGVALVVVAAAALRPEFRWTRGAALIAGGLGLGSGLFLAASGFSTGAFLAQLAGTAGQAIAPNIGIGIWVALLAAACAMTAVASPPRSETVPAVPADQAPIVYRLDDEDEPEEKKTADE